MCNDHSISQRHIMQKYKECSEKYDMLCRKIERLGRAYEIETDPMTNFKLEEQMDELERKRESIKQEMEALEDQRQAPDDRYLLKKALLKLDFDHQETTFHQLVKTSQVGAFVIHGELEHGQRWLLWRLIQRCVPFYQTAWKIQCRLPRGCKRDIATFRHHFISATQFTEPYSFQEVAAQLHQLWQSQPVILVLHDLNVLDRQAICEFWQEFWQPLVERALDKPCKSLDHLLLMFLVVNEDSMDTWPIDCTEHIEADWEPTIPIKLARLTRFSDDVLAQWKQKHHELLPKLRGIQIEEILHDSKGGIPELVLDCICQAYDCDWYKLL